MGGLVLVHSSAVAQHLPGSTLDDSAVPKRLLLASSHCPNPRICFTLLAITAMTKLRSIIICFPTPRPGNIDHSWWPQTQAEEKISKVLLTVSLLSQTIPRSDD